MGVLTKSQRNIEKKERRIGKKESYVVLKKKKKKKEKLLFLVQRFTTIARSFGAFHDVR